MSATNRRNRRATTDGRAIRDNRIYDVRVTSDGYGIGRSPAYYYRRHLHDGRVFTGLADDARS